MIALLQAGVSSYLHCSGTCVYVKYLPTQNANKCKTSAATAKLVYR